ISFVGQQDFVIKNNTIGPVGQAAAGHGIQLQYCANFEVSGNVSIESGNRGFYLQHLNTNPHIPNSEGLLYNNFVKTKFGYALQTEQTANLKIWHNNFLTTHLTLPTYTSTVRFLSSKDIDFRNNHLQCANSNNGYVALY